MSFAPLAIILGLSPTGLYAVRELAEIGVQILGITTHFSCGQFSSLLSHPDKFWHITEHRRLLQRLLLLAEGEAEPPVLLPTSDLYIDFITKYSTQLRPHFVFQHSYQSDIASSILDKGSFYTLCRAHNIATPEVWESGSKEELQSLSDKVIFPCILKPKLIHEVRKFMQGKKVLLARTREEFDNMAASIPIGGWLVQEVIPGPESNIFLFAGYFDTSGEPVQTFTARKLRQYPPGFGSASLVQSEIQQDVHELSISFLQALNFKGICGTEFKFDPRDNCFKMIEINPRATLWFNISNQAGKRFAQTAYLDMIGNKINDEVKQSDGVVWRYVLKDIYSTFFYLYKGGRFIFPPPEMKKKYRVPQSSRSWAVFNRRDPLPAFIEPLQFLNKLIQRREP
ncbi:MAG: hypothetical protein D3923_04715 [Candidatus Electrothrix sp. AR3]|nr:hypothetical protein [Candidatus Electrothrix sp. AR3]